MSQEGQVQFLNQLTIEPTTSFAKKLNIINVTLKSLQEGRREALARV